MAFISQLSIYMAFISQYIAIFIYIMENSEISQISSTCYDFNFGFTNSRQFKKLFFDSQQWMRESWIIFKLKCVVSVQSQYQKCLSLFSLEILNQKNELIV